MNKFCGHCGHLLNINDTVCTNCGANTSGRSNENPSHKKATMRIGAVCIAIAALLTIILVAINWGDQQTDHSSIFSVTDDSENPVELLQNVLNGDYDRASKLAPREFWIRERAPLIDDFVDELMYLRQEDQKLCGPSVEYTLGISGSKQVPLDEISHPSSWERRFNAFSLDIKKAILLEVEIEISGSYDHLKKTQELLALCINGTWYLSKPDYLLFIPEMELS